MNHTMTQTLRTTGLAALAAVTMLTSATAPALAGEDERNFLKGVAATVIVGSLIQNANRNRNQQPQYYVQPQQQYYVQPRHEPRYEQRHQRPRYQEPRYYAPEPVYTQPRGRIIGEPQYQSSIHGTPTAQAFNAYSSSSRRAIQRQLAAYGYYRGSIDGAWGPGTYRAVEAYARDTGRDFGLRSEDGAFRLYDGLIG